MKGTRAALRYAKATLDTAIEKDIVEAINNDMLLIDSTISENKNLQVLINSPIIKSDIKKATLTEIFGSKVNKLTILLINLLIDNNRIDLLHLVAKKFNIIYNHYRGKEVAQVTTAIPLTKELETKILAILNDLVDNEVSIENIIDPSIVGGFVLRVGDKQLDSSVSGILNNMLQKFEDNHYISKL